MAGFNLKQNGFGLTPSPTDVTPDDHFNVKAYGATGDGSTDDTAAVTAALAAADAIAPQASAVFFPPGTYLTTGGHTIPVGCVIEGSGVGNTVIQHSGNNVGFTYADTTDYQAKRPGIRDLHLKGNSGSSAVSVQVCGSFGFFLERVTIGDDSSGDGRYSNGVAVRLHNKETGDFCEGFTANDLSLEHNATGIEFKRTSGDASFAYTKLNDFSINIPASGIGIDLGGSSVSECHLYSAYFRGQIWFKGSSGIALYVRDFAKVTESYFQVRGEVLSGTGQVRFKTTGTATDATRLKYTGYFGFDSGAVTDDIGGTAVVRAATLDTTNEVGGYPRLNLVTSGSTTVVVTAGSGTPEGNVTAPVGSLYLRTDLTNGTIVYRKESGTGATGWLSGVSAGGTMRTRFHTCQSLASLTDGNDKQPTAGNSYFARVFVPHNCTLTGIAYLIGSVGGTDKVNVALANSAGTILANSDLAGTTVGSLATFQAVAFTAALAVAGPAYYYVLVQFDGNTCRFRSIVTANYPDSLDQICAGLGTSFGSFPSFSPGTTFTSDRGPMAYTY